jgi:hypothetical protein
MDEIIKFVLQLNYIIQYVVADFALDKYPSVLTIEADEKNISYFYKNSLEFNDKNIAFEMLFFKNRKVNIAEIKVFNWPYPVKIPGDVFYFSKDDLDEDFPFLFFYEESGNNITIRVFEKYSVGPVVRDNKFFYPVKKTKGSYLFPVMDQFTAAVEKELSKSEKVYFEDESVSFEDFASVISYLQSKNTVNKYFAGHLYTDEKNFAEFTMINKDATSCCVKIHQSILPEILRKPDIAKELMLEIVGYEFYGMLVAESLLIYETEQKHLK